MATNEIEIEVTLDDKKALKGLDKLEKAGESVGEGFNALGSSISAMGGEVNENLGALGESLGGVAGAITGAGAAAKGAGLSFSAMLGPIGLVAVALVEAYNALKAYTGETKQLEMRTDSYKAAAAEITAVIEELAASQVNLSLERIRELDTLAESAKVQIEYAQILREENAEKKAKIALLDEEIRKQDELLSQMAGVRANEAALVSLAREQTQLRAKRAKLAFEVSQQELIAAKNLQKGAREFAELEREKQEDLKKTAEYQQKIKDQEADLLAQAAVDNLAAQKEGAEAQTQIAINATNKRIREISRLEDISEEVKQKALAGTQQALQAQLDEIERKAQERRRAARQKRAAEAKMRAAQELALETRKQAELARIRMAEIEALKINGADALDVLQLQYEVQVTLAGDNQRKLTALELEFENKRTVIAQEEERKRQEAARVAAEEEQRRAQQRQAFLLSNLDFDARMMEDGLDKELTLLDLKYRREVELAEHTQEELTELQRRHEAERLAITERATKAQIEILNQPERLIKYTTALSEGLAESTYNAALFGESFTESIGEILVSLGRQAGVESLMELAKGTAALFLNPALASNHFVASAIFGSAAAIAGSAGKAMGGGGGGGASAAARGASPSGAPQTAPAPERERAESTSMVFNINFGNSTIYDTKRAAQDAMASEIMRTMNRQRRGSPRFMGV